MTRNIINKNKIQRVQRNHYPGLIGVHAYLLFSRWCHDYCSSDRLTLLSSSLEFGKGSLTASTLHL